MNTSIAFFDFDGTITTKDTLLEFIKHSKGTFRFYTGFLLNSPWLVAYRLKLISNQAAKERILSWFFRHSPLSDFQQQCDDFTASALPALLRPKAVEEIRRLQDQGFLVVIVSASPGNWINGWASATGVELLATRLATTPPAVNAPSPAANNHPAAAPERLTGRILGRNCYGPEKVSRIKESYTLEDYAKIHAYGDTRGDLPMLALAHHSFYKPFR